MYQYRWGQPSDLLWLDQAVAAGAVESLSAEQQAAVHPMVPVQQAQMQLRQALLTPGTALLVAQSGGQPVGYLVMAMGPDSSTDEPTAYLMDLWIAPSHRRRGLASGLLKLGEQWVASQRIRKIKLWTGIHREPVLSFAQRHGFATAGLIGVKEL